MTHSPATLTASLTYSVVRQPSGDIRVTTYQDGVYEAASDVGPDSIRYVAEDLKSRGYRRAEMTADVTAAQTSDFEAQVSAAIDALINAQDCFRQSQKYPMYSETRKSWYERETQYRNDFMTFRPKVRKEAYKRFEAVRQFVINNPA